MIEPQQENSPRLQRVYSKYFSLVWGFAGFGFYCYYHYLLIIYFNFCELSFFRNYAPLSYVRTGLFSLGLQSGLQEDRKRTNRTIK